MEKKTRCWIISSDVIAVGAGVSWVENYDRKESKRKKKKITQNLTEINVNEIAKKFRVAQKRNTKAWTWSRKEVQQEYFPTKINHHRFISVSNHKKQVRAQLRQT